MNTFFKFLLVIFALVLGIASVTQLQLIGFELMNEPDTFSFFLGLFYCSIVFFIIGAGIYIAVDYLKGFINKKKDSGKHESEQELNN